MAIDAGLELFETAHGERMRFTLHDPAQTCTGATAKIHLATPSGLIVETESPVAVDDYLEVSFSSEAQATARILWTSGKLFGCEFENCATGVVKLVPAQEEDLRARISGEDAPTRLCRMRQARHWAIECAVFGSSAE